MTETATATNPNEPATLLETPVIPAAPAAGDPGKANEQVPDPAHSVADDKPLADGKPGEGSQQTGAPEAYEFKAPEGAEYDPKVLESFAGAAKLANLPQDTAQKLIDTMAPALAARQVEQVRAIQDGWREQTSADKELGGDKAKLAANLAVAKKAYDAFDPIPEGQTTTALRTLLETTGLGNHPEIIRLLYRAGKAISEDTIVSASRPATPPKTLAERLYGKD